MIWVPRLLAWVLSWTVRTLLLLVMVGLIASAFLDISVPDGEFRGTWFFWALGLFNPRLRVAFTQTLVLAAAVTLIALVLGETIGVVARHSRGTRWLARLAWSAGFVMPPSVVALGSRNLVASVEVPETVSAQAMSLVLLVLSQLPWSLALTGTLITRRISRVDPRWSEMAWLAGGRMGVARAGRFLIRPIVRPEAARAASLVFLTVTLEPTAALVLGESRNLAGQIAAQVIDGGSVPMIAVTTLMALGLGLTGFGLIRSVGGVHDDNRPPAAYPGGPARTPMHFLRPPRRPLAVGLGWLAVVLNLAIILVPLVGLFDFGWRQNGWMELQSVHWKRFNLVLRHAMIQGLFAGSLAVLIAGAWVTASRGGMRLWTSRGISLMPAGILAVAVVVSISTLRSILQGFPLLGLGRDSLLVLVLAFAFFPTAVPVIRRGYLRTDPHFLEQARLGGPSGHRRIQRARWRFLAPKVIACLVALVWATAVEGQAALIFASSSEFQTPGPGLIFAAAHSGSLPFASLLGVGIILSGFMLRSLGFPAGWLGIVVGSGIGPPQIRSSISRSPRTRADF